MSRVNANTENPIERTEAEGRGDLAIAELDATRAVYEKLKSLSGEAQKRVLDHVTGLLDVDWVARRQIARRQDQTNGGQQEEADIQREQKGIARNISNLLSFSMPSNPETQAQMALVAGYWLQVCQGAETFDGFSANKELKQLGRRFENITAPIEALKNEKPALALQVGKSGKSRQARKTYKLSAAGIKSVEAMING